MTSKVAKHMVGHIDLVTRCGRVDRWVDGASRIKTQNWSQVTCKSCLKTFQWLSAMRKDGGNGIGFTDRVPEGWDSYMKAATGGVMTRFECPECEHQWGGTHGPTMRTRIETGMLTPSEFGGHDWETCPACGADDGENCWDCGECKEDMDDGMGGDMCTACRRTICWDCQRAAGSASPHHDGREADKGLCGATARVL